ncbi:MAG: WD40 repeat domain-containing protein, partial [Caulobacteraceae bacterium]|nr:WD40 repeat domain-containing protein [Caulobacter sp.]
MPKSPTESLRLGAYVAAALWRDAGWALATGDGQVRFEDGSVAEAHEGAVLCAAPHPSGDGVVTGGDDGRLAWSRPGGAAPVELANLGGRWIDAAATHPASGLIAFAAGRDVHVRDAADPAFRRRFAHERAAAALSFDPKGRRIAVATYGGARLWYARVESQTPASLAWAGSHTAVWWSPDGRFVVTAMQENDMHGWRLSDGKDMRMSGYPSKVRSAAFLSKGALLATAGAAGAVCWPFVGAGGPMGKDAVQIGEDEAPPGGRPALVTRVAAVAAGSRL